MSNEELTLTELDAVSGGDGEDWGESVDAAMGGPFPRVCQGPAPVTEQKTFTAALTDLGAAGVLHAVARMERKRNPGAGPSRRIPGLRFAPSRLHNFTGGTQMSDVARMMPANAIRELAPQELEAVAGGGKCGPPRVVVQRQRQRRRPHHRLPALPERLWSPAEHLRRQWSLGPFRFGHWSGVCNEECNANDVGKHDPRIDAGGTRSGVRRRNSSRQWTPGSATAA